MAVYTPPFKFQYGYIYDSQNLMVADNGEIVGEQSVKGAVAARVRGWGRIGYMPNAAQLQDEIGVMMADALNMFYFADMLEADGKSCTQTMRREDAHE